VDGGQGPICSRSSASVNRESAANLLHAIVRVNAKYITKSAQIKHQSHFGKKFVFINLIN
jgi:hypothetical protein